MARLVLPVYQAVQLLTNSSIYNSKDCAGTAKRNAQQQIENRLHAKYEIRAHEWAFQFVQLW